MKAFYCDQFVLPLPEGHRFPMEKYRLLRERVAAGELDRAEARRHAEIWSGFALESRAEPIQAET